VESLRQDEFFCNVVGIDISSDDDGAVELKSGGALSIDLYGWALCG